MTDELNMNRNEDQNEAIPDVPAIKKNGVSSMFSKIKATTLNMIENRRIKMAAREAELRERRLKGLQEKLLAYRANIMQFEKFTIPKTIARLATIDTELGSDAKAIEVFLEHDLTKKLSRSVESRARFYARDIANQKPGASFTAKSGELLACLPSDQVSRTLQAIANKYKISNAGSGIAAGVLAARKNYGGAAAVAINNGKVAYHNGRVSAIFTDHIRHLNYTVAGPSIPDEVRKAYVIAKRFEYFGLGDSQILSRAMFSISYWNGNTPAIPPEPINEYSSELHPQFHNHFRGYVFTVQQAVEQINVIARATAYNTRIWQATDVLPFLQDYKDELPTMESLVAAGH
jgi:hypothetical protein